MRAGGVVFSLFELHVPVAAFGCRAAPAHTLGAEPHEAAGSLAKRLLGAAACHREVPWGKRRLLSWREEGCHRFISKGLFFLVQPSSNRLNKEQTCWHVVQSWLLRCIKGDSAHTLLHLPKHHLHASGNLCSGSSQDPTGERACDSALEICNTNLERLPSPVAS